MLSLYNAASLQNSRSREVMLCVLTLSCHIVMVIMVDVFAISWHQCDCSSIRNLRCERLLKIKQQKKAC